MPIQSFTKETRNADGLSCKCRACLMAERKTRRVEDPAAFDAHAKAYKARNKEKVRQRASAYARKRRANDPQFRFRGAVTRLVGSVLRNRGSSKGGAPFFETIGYTIEDLAAHIEKQFTSGMKWANYGDWHLEHIIPNARFDYRSMGDQEFMACWALPNLRPLWKVDNLKKSDKVLTLL